MFDESLIQKLKQTNISVDSEKTLQRAKELWSGTTKDDKDAIEKMAGVSRPTIYRIFSIGSISAKIVISMAQVLNVDPFYVTGETDQAGQCSDEIILAFLTRHGYSKLLASISPIAAAHAQKKRRKGSMPKEEQAQELAAMPVDQPTEETEPDTQAACHQPIDTAHSPESDHFENTLTEDDMILLLRSMLLRANAGVESAAALVQTITKLLLS